MRRPLGAGGRETPGRRRFFSVSIPKGCQMEKPFAVSGTPAGVPDVVTAAWFRWSPLRYDRRLPYWQAFGLFLLWKHSALCLHTKHLPG